MNRGRFNSPIFSAFGHNNISPDMNVKSKNSDLRDSMSPDFIPFQYSSPLSSFKNNDSINRRKYHRGSIRRGHDRSFNSPQSGGSSYNSPYNSSGFNHSGDFRKSSFNNRQRNNQNPNSSAYNSKLYYNESMIKDPWEDLERQFKEEKEINVVQENLNENKDFNNDNDFGSESDELSTKINDDEEADRNSSSDEKDNLSSSANTTATTISTTFSDS